MRSRWRRKAGCDAAAASARSEAEDCEAKFLASRGMGASPGEETSSAAVAARHSRRSRHPARPPCTETPGRLGSKDGPATDQREGNEVIRRSDRSVPCRARRTRISPPGNALPRRSRRGTRDASYNHRKQRQLRVCRSLSIRFLAPPPEREAEARPSVNAHASGRIPTRTRCAADRGAPPGASDRRRQPSQAGSRRAAANKQALSPKAGRQGGVRAGLWASRRPDPRPCECATRQTRARDLWRRRRRRQCAHR